MVIELATINERRSERAKIIRRYSHEVSCIVAQLCDLHALDGEPCAALRRDGWKPRASARRLDAGNLFEPRHNIASHHCAALRVFEAEQLEIHRHKVVGYEARVYFHQLREALNQKA